MLYERKQKAKVHIVTHTGKNVTETKRKQNNSFIAHPTFVDNCQCAGKHMSDDGTV